MQSTDKGLRVVERTRHPHYHRQECRQANANAAKWRIYLMKVISHIAICDEQEEHPEESTEMHDAQNGI